MGGPVTLVLVKRRQVLRATAPGSPGTDGRPGPQDGREPFAPGTGTRAGGGGAQRVPLIIPFSAQSSEDIEFQYTAIICSLD